MLRNNNLLNQTNLRIIFSITLMAVTGVSSITPAFPQVEQALDVSAKEVGLLITFFTIPGVLLTPLLGILADRLGRKKILVPSLFIFGLAGASCFVANSFEMLLTLRFMQGVGGASLGSLNITLIGDLYSGKERAAAMGYNASVLSIGTAGYPAIGGALALLGWNFPFLLPILAIPVGLIVIYKLKNPEPDNEVSFRKYLGNTWQSIKNTQVIVLFSVSIFTFIILFGSFLTFFPFLTNHQFNASSLEIGILMSATSITTAIISSQAGKLTDLYSERRLMIVAFILYTISLLIIPFINSLWMLLIPVMIFGAAQGLNLPGFLALLTDFAPIEHRAAFMSINGMVLRAGQTLGPVVMGFVFDAFGIKYVFFSGALLSVMMFFLIAIFLKKKSPEES